MSGACSNGRRGRTACVLLCAAWLAFIGPIAVAGSGPGRAWAKGDGKEDEARQKALERLQRKIEREQRALGEVDRQRAGVVENLGALEQTLADQERDLQQAESAVAEAARSKQAVEETEARLQIDLRELEGKLGNRLIALYKLRAVGYFRVLFSSRDYQDLSRRTRFLRTIVAADAGLVDRYHAKLTEAREQGKVLEAERSNLARLRETADGRRVEVEARRSEKMALLEELGREKEARLAVIAEYEEAARALEGTFEALQEAAPAPDAPLPGGAGVAPGSEPLVPFSAARGRVPMPVRGRLIKRFGLRADPELGTQIRSNGITLRAPYGEPIEAVHDGRVLYAGWFRGYGRILITDHGEGYYSLIAHASELLKKVGDRVMKGDVVARVGESGSLEGPIVYFEIRERGKPLDPMDWISR
ncbi:MAG: peptidoglycan DD-metalloendopeptidase family protein [Deltaproteobacteria bacterium]|nr:peptidoglycan DD-metalloendopeptidase family protein [Deltaproteobacteria bacterium]